MATTLRKQEGKEMKLADVLFIAISLNIVRKKIMEGYLGESY